MNQNARDQAKHRRAHPEREKARQEAKRARFKPRTEKVDNSGHKCARAGQGRCAGPIQLHHAAGYKPGAGVKGGVYLCRKHHELMDSRSKGE